MTRFNIVDTPFADLKLIRRNPIMDNRGYFERLVCVEELETLLQGKKILQINHASTLQKGVVRGMHFQVAPCAEMKIITCLRGEIYDVVVDIRSDSSTYQQWYGVTLTENNFQSLIIPEGFAHGYQSLTNNVDVVYLSTAMYNSDAEKSFNPLDGDLKISWPCEVTMMSAKDESSPHLKNLYLNE